MQVAYKTIISVDVKTPIENLFDLTKNWIIGSQHKLTGIEQLEQFTFGDEKKLEYRNEVTQYSFHNDEGLSAMLFSFEEVDKIGRANVTFLTEVVGVKEKDRFDISISISRESDDPSFRLNKINKPYLVKMIIKDLSSGKDGGFTVDEKPKKLEYTDNDLGLAYKIVNFNTSNRMPIVYISAWYRHYYFVDPDELSKKLSGMAHVVIEPDTEFSKKLISKYGKGFPFNGAVAVYWPEGKGWKKFIAETEYEDCVKMESEIISHVEESLVLYKTPYELTPLYIKEMQSKHRISMIHKKSSEFNDLFEVYENDINTKDMVIDDCRREIEMLKQQLKVRNTLDVDESLSFKSGIENEFYSGEIRDVILDHLASLIQNMREDARGTHLIKSFVNANKKYGNYDRKKKELKDLEKSLDRYSEKNEKSLENIGFKKISDNKHVKMFFYGDSRYSTTIQKTGSDHRGAKNTVRDIRNTIF